MGTTTQSTSQIVCPFCGHEARADEIQTLERPVHHRRDYVQIFRCRKCKLLFAPVKDALLTSS